MVVTFNFPTEMIWQRIAHSTDMNATDDINSLPPRWNSSLAIFKYVPDDEYQIYPGRKITYLKIVCTLTGYQAKDKEIEEKVNWNKIKEGELKHNIDELLTTYYPCAGALLQVLVTPVSTGIKYTAEQYPFIMDASPRKRELYEIGTDTNEISSMSLDNISTGKASGSTDSNEVISTTISRTAEKYVPVPALESISGKTTVGSLDSQTLETTDKSREARLYQSHTTQISNLYTQLQSYHIGTNRIVFLVESRPHTLSIPSYFVRSASRPVDGVQDFFLIVNQSINQPDFCVMARLDTSHYFGTSTEFKEDVDETVHQVFFTARGLKTCPNKVVGTEETSYEVEHFSGVVGQDNVKQSNKDVIQKKSESPKKTEVKSQNTATDILSLRPELVTIRKVNELSRLIMKSLRQNLLSNRRYNPGEISFLDLDFVSNSLLHTLRHSERGSTILNTPAISDVPKEYHSSIKRKFGKDVGRLNRGQLLSLDNNELSELLQIDKPRANRLRLAILGIPIK